MWMQRCYCMIHPLKMRYSLATLILYWTALIILILRYFTYFLSWFTHAPIFKSLCLENVLVSIFWFMETVHKIYKIWLIMRPSLVILTLPQPPPPQSKHAYIKTVIGVPLIHCQLSFSLVTADHCLYQVGKINFLMLCHEHSCWDYLNYSLHLVQFVSMIKVHGSWFLCLLRI